VIVHPSSRFDALSRSKVSYLFLRKVSRWPWGAEVAPANLTADEPIRREFIQQVLRMTEEQLADYWIDQRVTRGVSPPVEVRDAAAAKRWVAAKPGGIAYIPSSALDATVKAIRVDA
jgi:DNA-binding transcriptional LysR family regulator